MSVEDELKHFGILGMKWGVRRYQNPDGTRTSAGKARQEKVSSAINKFNEAGKAHQAKTDARDKARQEKVSSAINKFNEAGKAHQAKTDAKVLKKQDKNFAKPAHMKSMINKIGANLNSNEAYIKEAEQVAQKLSKTSGLTGRAFENAYQTKMVDVIDKYMREDKSTYSPSGNMRISMGLVELNGNNFMTPVLLDARNLKHAEDEYVHGLYIVDKKGNLKLVNDETFEHVDKNEFLAHHGILGMKWGVRRTPGADGTVSGKGKSKSQGSGDYQRSRKQLSRGSKNLSTKELKDLTQRLQLERQLKDLQPNQVKNGAKIVKNALAVGTTLSAMYGLTQSPLGKSIASNIKFAVNDIGLKRAYRSAMGG